MIIEIGQLNSNLEDTGWKTLTVADNFELYDASVPIRYRKIGNIVHICGAVKNKNEMTSSVALATICTLPNGCFPITRLNIVSQGSGLDKWSFEISTSGVVSFSRYGDTLNTNITAGKWLPFSAVFMVA